jgi:hypothetical protein
MPEHHCFRVGRLAEPSVLGALLGFPPPGAVVRRWEMPPKGGLFMDLEMDGGFGQVKAFVQTAELVPNSPLVPKI